MRKKLLFFTILLSFSSLTFSQTKKNTKSVSSTSTEQKMQNARVFAPNGIVRCATDEYTIYRNANRRVASEKAFEEWLAPKIEEIKRLRQARMLPSVIRIPVVVHVIHNGDAVGSGENIANGQVLSQIQVFNEDFRKLPGTPGDGAGVDTTIEFCMAQVDPNGNPTNGIDRVNLGTPSFTSMGAIETAKAATIWDPTKYLNMWTFRFGGGMSTTLGYAQFPTGSGLAGFGSDPCIDTTGGGGDASTDGVVCNYNTWGSSTIFPGGSYGAPYDKGRTMTHELGHMLGLFHTFQGGCAGENETSGDYCDDTPAVSTPNFGCVPTDSCPTGGVDMISNYMDYSDDTCMSVFTQDQKDRMLAVLMNSPRRDDLLKSNVCDATPNTPYIQFKREACLDRQPKSGVEGNGCSFTEYTIPLSIDMAPSQNATVTFTIDALSVANAGDVQIVTPTVTFNAGSTADQNLIFRVLQDGVVEADEELIISFTVNANGGNALANPKGNSYEFTILNDDNSIAPILSETLFSENFDPIVNNFNIYDEDGDGNNWGINNEANFGTSVGFNGNFLLSLSWDSNPAPNGTPLNPNNYVVTEALSIPVGASNIVLTFDSGTLEAAPYHEETYAVYLGTASTPAAIAAQTPVFQETLSVPQSFSTKTINLSPALAGQTVYLAFRHYNTTDMNTLIIDDISITYDQVVNVQTAVDMVTAGQTNLSGSGSSNFRDSSNENIIGGIQVNDTSNYGCTDMYVSSAGTGATQYGASTNLLDYRMNKQFTVVPTNVVTGNATVTFYFTEAEIAGWEAATGNVRTALYAVKDNGSEEIQACTIGAFGSDVTLTATFASGIDGVYSFARQQSLSNDNFELTGVNIYPNPNAGSFNLSLQATSNQVKVEIFDTRGRLIMVKDIIGNNLINEEINLGNTEAGIYFVNIKDGKRKTTKKIIKQ